MRVVSVYVPNGREVGTDFYERKLVWLADAARLARGHAHARRPVVVLGDFNVAPEDRDVWDPEAFVGATHVTAPERDAVAQLEQWGLDDAVPARLSRRRPLYSYWDYRAGDFHQHRGMRIDLVLGDATRRRPRHVGGGRPQRPQGHRPSDHAPVIIDLAD